MKRIIVLLPVLYLCTGLLSAVPSLSSAATNADVRARLENGTPVSITDANAASLLQPVPLFSAAYGKAVQTAAHTHGFVTASAFLIPYPASWQREPLSPAVDTEHQLILFNLLHKVSTQKGITYISRRSGYKPRALFTESHYIAGPDSKEKQLQDPVVEQIPQTDTGYVYQDDSAFGGNVYRHTYTDSDGEIFLEVTNETPLKYHGFTCIKKQELSLCTAVTQTDKGILLYAMTVVSGHEPKVKVLFFTVDLESSFTRRITAMQNWFSGLLE